MNTKKMNQPECRIRHCKKGPDGHECYIFEIRQPDEKEFDFAKSFPVIDDRISYMALTEIRELTRLGYSIIFA